MIELYAANTGNGRRATLMIEECGLPYRLHKVTIGAENVKPPDLLKINPQGTIPTVLDPDGPDGKPLVLTQSLAILIYLAEKTGKLLPRDGLARIAAFQWALHAMTDLAPASSAINFMAKNPEAKAFFEGRLLGYCRVSDRRLGEHAWLAGSDITIADIVLYSVIWRRLPYVEKDGALPNLRRWAKAMESRPSVQRVIAALS